MKKYIFPFLVSMLLCFSCSTDNDADITEPDPILEEEPVITATETCLFSDFDIQENASITIDCLLDLEGATIDLPAGVTFNFDGGDIFNGTLNFGTSGKIDGALLNADLTLQGDVSLLSDNFQFVPERWSIVEVDDPNNPEPPTLEVAYRNHKIIQETLNTVYELGATTFSINELNAYFDCLNGETDFRAALNAIIIVPDDFNLKMSDNTFIRVLPVSGVLSSNVIKVFQGSNISISGGNLIGDRLEHGPEEGGSTMVVIQGGKNIVVDNINVRLSSHTGLTILSWSFLERDDYFGSENVTISNSTFDSNRTNNISLTDGQNIIIEGNTAIGAGKEMEGDFGTSSGIAPRIGIVVETQKMQFIKNVEIRNNIVEDSGSLEGHDILIAGATDIEIIGNTAEKSIGWSSGLNVQVINNTSGRIFGGFLGFEGRNNVISGNTVTNPNGAGIFLTDQNVEVFDNDLINCRTGIQLSSIINVDVYDNRITSNVQGSIGIEAQNYLDKVQVYDNDFNLEDGKPLNLIAINTEVEHQDYLFSFTENRITATENGLMPGSSNITISDNDFDGAGITLSRTSATIVSDNRINNTGNFAAFSVDNSDDITVTGNTFEGTNDGPFATAVKISNSSDLTFHNNMLQSIGVDFGMNATSVDNISIQGNTIQNTSTIRPPLSFFGDNSQIIGNTFINNNNNLEGFIIEGNGNTISGNN